MNKVPAKTGRGVGGHHKAFRGRTDEWLTPELLIRALTQRVEENTYDEFDLDPCSPIVRPWPTALKHLTINDDGLKTPWPEKLDVYLNPPYGPDTAKWLEKLANHGYGTALIFARTETEAFFRWVWRRADALFFLKGRLTFCHVDGSPGHTNSGGPSVLVAYGKKSVDRLIRLNKTNRFVGQFIPLRKHD